MAQVEPRPGDAAPRPRTDAGLRRFARFVMQFLFRDVELVGAENLPSKGPVIVVANHSNSLVDGAILTGFLPRVPRFLAASTVWDYKPVVPFMNASGAVKVYRKQDGRSHEGSLEDSFAEAAALLADGGVLAVFPEGRTHDNPGLLPFKTGTARIAAKTHETHGPLDLAIVPVGVNYEVKNLFRTRACVVFGPPVKLKAKVLTAPGAAPGADGVRWATGKLRKSLVAVAPDYPSWDEAAALGVAAEIEMQSAAGDRKAPRFSNLVALRKDLAAALERADPTAARDTRAALGAYAGLLAEHGLADREVAVPPNRTRLAASALALVPGLPVLLIAALFNGPQALLLSKVSRSKPRDRQLTWLTFGGVVVYAVTWLLWALLCGLVAGGGWGWIVAPLILLAAPLSAKLALPLFDRARQVAARIRAWQLYADDVTLLDRLNQARARARGALANLQKTPGAAA